MRFKFLLILLTQIVFATNIYAQNARSLFSNSSGVAFESNTNEAVVKDTGKESANIAPKNVENSVNNEANKSKPITELKKSNQKQEKNDARDNSIIRAEQAAKYSGLSYTLFQQFANGELRKVSPTKIFRTGDRIKLIITSNRSGELSVANINPEGKVSILSELTIAAGASVNVPPNGLLRFVGNPGVEQLIFSLSNKSLSKETKDLESPLASIISSCFRNKSTRSLIVDDSAGNQAGIVSKDGNCVPSSQSKTRSLVVEVANDSGYAVLPDSLLAEGQILTLKINLRHQ
jgi:hypothetical protein